MFVILVSKKAQYTNYRCSAEKYMMSKGGLYIEMIFFHPLIDFLANQLIYM